MGSHSIIRNNHIQHITKNYYVVFIYMWDFLSLFLMSLYQKLHQKYEFSMIISLFFLSLDCWVVNKILCTSSPPASESSAEHCHAKELIVLTAQLCRWSGDGEETATTQERRKGRPQTGRVSRAAGTAALWKGSRRGNCCRCLGQRQRRNYSRTKGGKDAVPRHLRHRSLGGQMGVQRSGSQYIISWKIRNPCLLERMISSPNLATGGRVIMARSSVDPDPQKSASHHTAQT